MFDEMMLSEMVRAHRRRLAMSQEDLSDKTGIGVRTIRDIETGRVGTPRQATLRLLADVFGLQGVNRDRFYGAAHIKNFSGIHDSIDDAADGNNVVERVVSQPAPRLIARRAMPFQVPAPPADFVGRAEQLRDLQRRLLFGIDEDRPGPRICVISGAAGVGKTVLAFSVAQAVWAGFPDGQLFVDLQGAGPQRMASVEALARLLRSLGVQDQAIPIDVQECAALYRTTLAGRRTLIVLDNVYEAAQVRPLLPGAGSCAVLITSRSRLAGLEAAVLTDLDIFDPLESLALLAAIVGERRVSAETQAAQHLVSACGGLPLALRVVGARLAGHPQWTLAGLVQRLGDRQRRLDELKVEDLAVEASFELSYRDLPPSLARVFRMVCLIPGAEFGIDAAAAVLGWQPLAAGDALAALAEANLVQPKSDSRYGFHDLLRIYAQQQAQRYEPASSRASAINNLLDWYLRRVVEAMRLVYPGMVRLDCAITGHSDTFETSQQALNWLDGELPALQAAIQAAARDEPLRYAWQLADQLRGYFLLRRHTVAWLSTGQTGLAAAQRADDLQAQAAMHQSLGQAMWSAGRHARALLHYQQAREMAQKAGWQVAVAYLHHGIGQVEADLGRLNRAEASYLEGMRISTLHGFEYVQAVIFNDLGRLCYDQGMPIRALENFHASLEINNRLGHHTSATRNRHNIAMIQRQQGNVAVARHILREQLAQDRAQGSPINVLATLDELSQLHTQVKEHDDALNTAREALDLTRECADPRAEAAVLCTLGQALIAAGATADGRAQLHAAHTIATQRSYPFYTIRAQIGLAEADYRDDLLASARQQARSALDSAHSHAFGTLEVDALLLLAQIYLSDGNTDQATEACHAALRAQAGQTTHQTNVARRLIQQALRPNPSKHIRQRSPRCGIN